MRVRWPVLRAGLSRTGKQLLSIKWQAGRGEVEDNEVKKADSTDIGIVGAREVPAKKNAHFKICTTYYSLPLHAKKPTTYELAANGRPFLLST